MPSLSIKQQVLWNILGSICTKCSGLVITLALARLLSPEHFGLLAVASVIVTFAQTLTSGGLGQALVQKEFVTSDDADTAFWSNMVFGALAYLTIFYSATWLGTFFEKADITEYLQVCAVSLIFTSINVTPIALIQKQGQFKTLANVRFFAAFVSGLVAIIFAWFFRSEWALALQVVLLQALTSVGLWYVHDWRPAIVFSSHSFRSLYRLGFSITLTRLLGSLSDESATVVIGKFFDTQTTGHYYTARRLNNMLQSQLIAPLQEAMLPNMAKLQNDPIELLQLHRKSLRYATFLVFPLTYILVFVLPDIIVLIIGNKWLTAAGYAGILGGLCAFFPFYAATTSLVTSLGRGKLLFYWSVVKNLVSLGVLAFTVRYEVAHIIYGQIICALILLIPLGFISKKLLQYHFIDQVADHLNTVSCVFLSGFLTNVTLGLVEYWYAPILSGGLFLSLYVLIGYVLKNPVLILILRYVSVQKLNLRRK